MDSIYFSVMLLGVAWICVWVAVDKPDPGFGWWPFDMIDDAPKQDAKEEPVPARAPRPGRTPRADQASSGMTPSSPAPPAMPPRSWRQRIASRQAPLPAEPTPTAARPAGRNGQAPGRRRR